MLMLPGTAKKPSAAPPTSATLVTSPPVVIDAALTSCPTVMPISFALLRLALPSRLPAASIRICPLEIFASSRFTSPLVLVALKLLAPFSVVAIPLVPITISLRVVTRISFALTVPCWMISWITSLLLAWPISIRLSATILPTQTLPSRQLADSSPLSSDWTTPAFGASVISSAIELAMKLPSSPSIAPAFAMIAPLLALSVPSTTSEATGVSGIESSGKSPPASSSSAAVPSNGVPGFGAVEGLRALVSVAPLSTMMSSPVCTNSRSFATVLEPLVKVVVPPDRMVISA